MTVTIVYKEAKKMKRDLESSYSHAADDNAADRILQDNHVSERRGNSTNRSQIACEKFKSGYNESANGGSVSHNPHGENTMDANTDVKLDAINTKIDSNEKVMKAELSGQRSYMDGRFEVVLGEIKASRTESQGLFQAVLGEVKAVRAESQGQFNSIQAQFQTILAKIEASEFRTRLWVIFTGAAIVAGSVGFVAASIAIWKAFSGS